MISYLEVELSIKNNFYLFITIRKIPIESIKHGRVSAIKFLSTAVREVTSENHGEENQS